MESMRDKKFLTAFIIISLAFLAALNPYWLLFSVPVFLIGLVILWLSNKRKKTKLAWTLLPVILWFPFMVMLSAVTGAIANVMAKKVDLLFPAGFTGKVLIIEEMPCGQKINELDGREQLIFSTMESYCTPVNSDPAP